MSNAKRLRRPLRKEAESPLIHEELFDGIASEIGCQCDKHGGGWIQCTHNECAVWHCMDDVTDTYVLLEEEIDQLQDSKDVFKCIVHGFNSMDIGHKSSFEQDTTTNDNKKNIEHEYTPNDSTKTQGNTNNYNNRKRPTSPTIDPYVPPAKKRKIDCNYLHNIPALEPHRNSNNTNVKPHVIDGQNIHCMTKSELKSLCSKKGLKVSGNKPQLIDRLLNPSSTAKKRKKKIKPISLMQIPYENRKQYIVYGFCRENSSLNVVVIMDIISAYASLMDEYKTRSIRYAMIRNVDHKMSELGSPLREYYQLQKEKKERHRTRVSLANCFKYSDNTFEGDEQNFLELFALYVEERHKTKTGYSIDLKVGQFCEALGKNWKTWWYSIYPSRSQIGIRLDKRRSWTVKFDVYSQSISFCGGLQNTGPYL